MPELIDNVTVKAGRIIRVKNSKQHRMASPVYHSVWVEDADGENERCLLFTARELAVAEARAAKNPEDIPEKGMIQDMLD